MSEQLHGQVALVTGASRGIGRAIAERLARAGALVAVNYLQRQDAAEETLASIRASGGQAELCRFDVANGAEVTAALQNIVARQGKVDILVNNAGLALDNLLLRLKEEDWERVMQVNLKGVFLCTKAAARFMVRQRSGRIVNLTSVVAQTGNAGQAAYSAAKAGIIGFTKTMAKELASRAITVNAVAPGFIATEMTGSLPEQVKTGYLSLIPAGRWGTAAEVAEVVTFLASPLAGYITGQVININGGMYV
ncbi:MAG TPA: 3-oxoacyl-[acyl-carrier-protein] reductase [Candidatus Binatia bacterium]|jgi:3-oxoacyl-[acyl-carrier protein] reductase|nr:3-oxoacyl-[acyl-carrier-protein] reductase [Candidatus Binatia bacterium]